MYRDRESFDGRNILHKNRKIIRKGEKREASDSDRTKERRKERVLQALNIISLSHQPPAKELWVKDSLVILN